MTTITESDIEEAALDWFAELGYTVLHGPEIAPGASDAERSTYKEVVLTRRLRGCGCPPKSKHTPRSAGGGNPKSAPSRFRRAGAEQPCISPDAG